MFIAINRLYAKEGREPELEADFSKSRGLEKQEGFVSFELLRQSWGPPRGEGVEFLVVTRWRSQDDFLAWTRSDDFKQAHSRGRPDYLAGGGHPSGYDVALERRPESANQ